MADKNLNMTMNQLDAELLLACFQQRADMRPLFFETEYSLVPRVEYRVIYDEAARLKPENSYPNILLWKEKSQNPYVTLISLEAFVQVLAMPNAGTLFDNYDLYKKLLKDSTGIIDYYNQFQETGKVVRKMQEIFQAAGSGGTNPIIPMLKLYTLFCKEVYSLQMYATQLYNYNNNTVPKFFIPFSYLIDRFATNMLLVVRDLKDEVRYINNVGERESARIASNSRKFGTIYGYFENGVRRLNKDNMLKTNVLLYTYQSEGTLVGRPNPMAGRINQIEWSASHNVPEGIDTMRYRGKIFSREDDRTKMTAEVHSQYIFNGTAGLLSGDHVDEEALDVLMREYDVGPETYLFNYPFLNANFVIENERVPAYVSRMFGDSETSVKLSSKRSYGFHITV